MNLNFSEKKSNNSNNSSNKLSHSNYLNSHSYSFDTSDKQKQVKMGSGGQQYFSLRWNSYQTHMTSVFHKLLETQSFVDVTLACENHYLKAHKVSFYTNDDSDREIISLSG